MKKSLFNLSLSLLLTLVSLSAEGGDSVQAGESREELREVQTQISPQSRSAQLVVQRSVLKSDELGKTLQIQISLKELEEDKYQPPLANFLAQDSSRLPGTSRGCSQKGQDYFGEIAPLFENKNPINLKKASDFNFLELPFKIIKPPQVLLHISLVNLETSEQMMLEKIPLEERGILNIKIDNLNYFPGQYAVTVATYCQQDPRWYVRSILNTSS